VERLYTIVDISRHFNRGGIRFYFPDDYFETEEEVAK